MTQKIRLRSIFICLLISLGTDRVLYLSDKGSAGGILADQFQGLLLSVCLSCRLSIWGFWAGQVGVLLVFFAGQFRSLLRVCVLVRLRVYKG